MTKQCIEFYIKDWNEKRFFEVNKLIGRRTRFILGGEFTFQYEGDLSLFVDKLEVLKSSDIYIIHYDCYSRNGLRLHCKRLLTNETFDVECVVIASKMIEKVERVGIDLR